MKTYLVGYTGFVGSNLANSHQFDGLYNSKNITDAFDSHPDLLVYAGIPARKFYANQNPDEDLKIIKNAEENIKKINPKKLILISTIDVISHPDDFYETDQIDESALQPYGRNRLILENWAKSSFKNHLIVRLPALYGQNLKKNFIFDMIHPIPSLIEQSQFETLFSQDPALNRYYQDGNDGYFKLKDLGSDEQATLLSLLKKLNFTALNFTDSRAKYQFYDLKNLWSHLEIALKNDINLLHLATEPISAAKLYEYIFHQPFNNELDSSPASYNYKTLYADLFGGGDGYIFNKEAILSSIESFVKKALEEKL